MTCDRCDSRDPDHVCSIPERWTWPRGEETQLLFPVGNDELVALSEIVHVSHSSERRTTTICVRGRISAYTVDDMWARLYREISIAAAKEREPITLEAMR